MRTFVKPCDEQLIYINFKYLQNLQDTSTRTFFAISK